MSLRMSHLPCPSWFRGLFLGVMEPGMGIEQWGGLCVMLAGTTAGNCAGVVWQQMTQMTAPCTVVVGEGRCTVRATCSESSAYNIREQRVRLQRTQTFRWLLSMAYF